MARDETLNENIDRGSLREYIANEMAGPHPDLDSILHTSAELAALIKWKEAAGQSIYKPFFDLVESVTSYRRLEADESTKDQIGARLSHALTARGNRLGPVTADFYLALVDCAFETPSMPKLELNRQKIYALDENGLLDVLFDPGVGFEKKLSVFYGQFAGYLEGLGELDVLAAQRFKERSGEREELAELNEVVSNDDVFKPRFEEANPEEESVILWEIPHARKQGYYVRKAFDVWDPVSSLWTRAPEQYTALKGVKDSPHFRHHYIRGVLGTELRAIPVLHGYAAYKYTWRAVGDNYKFNPDYDYGYDLIEDSFGNYTARAHSTGTEVDIYMTLAASDRPPAGELPEMRFDFQDDTRLVLQEVSALNGSLAQASALARFVMRRFTYSNASTLNEIYNNYPSGYLSAIDYYRLVDCDVANTYFAALCSQIGIRFKFDIGFFAHRYKDLETGTITAADGHAWLEVWDDLSMKWVIVDATPSGAFDPTMGTATSDKALTDEFTEGDFLLDARDLQEIQNQMKWQESKLVGLPTYRYSPQEVRFSESAGVSLWDARSILNETAKVEAALTLDGQSKVTDALSLFWDLISTEMANGSQIDLALRSKKAGGQEIDDISAHYIGILSSDYDPQTRSYTNEVQHEEKVCGGFDVFLCLDRSASMSMLYGGKNLMAQRDAAYLLFRSLSNFTSRQARSGGESLSVRTMALSFDQSDSVVIDKPFSSDLSDREIARMWRSMGIRGSGNADVPLLEHVLTLIRDEKAANKEHSGLNPDRLKIVLVFSDGMPAGYDELTAVVSEIGKEGAVVVGIGIGDEAGTVPILFDTPYSTGVIANSPADYVSIVARKVMANALDIITADDQSRKQLESLIERFSL